MDVPMFAPAMQLGALQPCRLRQLPGGHRQSPLATASGSAGSAVSRRPFASESLVSPAPQGCSHHLCALLGNLLPTVIFPEPERASLPRIIAASHLTGKKAEVFLV